MAARVRAVATQQGLKAAPLARALGIGSSSADLYWKGTRPWPTHLLARLGTLLETTVDHLLGHEAPGSGDLVPVAEIDLAYGLGGTYADVQVEAEVVRFERAWLESITRTPPVMLTFARGRGDSMQPTLQDGDIVLIDRSIRAVREQDALWALTVGDIAMIKRLRMRGEQVSILSDNDRVPPDEYHHEEVNVVGRVIFIGRKI